MRSVFLRMKIKRGIRLSVLSLVLTAVVGLVGATSIPEPINTSQSFLWKLSHAQGIGAVEAIEVSKGISVSVKAYRTEGADKAVNTIRERAYQEIPDNLKDSFAIAKEDVLVTLNADKTVQEQVLPDNTARDAVVHQLYYWLTPQNGNLWDPFIDKKVTVKPAKLVLNQKIDGVQYIAVEGYGYVESEASVADKSKQALGQAGQAAKDKLLAGLDKFKLSETAKQDVATLLDGEIANGYGQVRSVGFGVIGVSVLGIGITKDKQIVVPQTIKIKNKTYAFPDDWVKAVNYPKAVTYSVVSYNQSGASDLEKPANMTTGQVLIEGLRRDK